MLNLLLNATHVAFAFSASDWLHDVSFAPLTHQAATFAVNLLVQTTLVLSIGMFAAWVVRHCGAALQSCVLRMTLVATLFCPVASWLLNSTGISGFRIELSKLEPIVRQADVILVPKSPPSDPTEPNPAELAPVDAKRFESDATRDSFQNSLPTGEDAVQAQSDAIPNPTAFAESPLLPTSHEKPSPDPKPDSSRTPLFYYAICAVWLFTSGVMLVRLIVANLIMEGIRRKSRPAPENVVCDCLDIARQLEVIAPPVLINERLSSPCLLGWLRPAVMIPASLRPVSSDVLIHELAHLRRHDCFWNLLGHLVIAMLPWQPLAWLLTRRMEQAADNVCDDYVVVHCLDRISYARELVAIAQRYPAGWTTVTAAVGIAEFQSCLGSRVQRILDCSRTLSLKTGRKSLLLVIAASLTGTLIAGFLGVSRNAHNDALFAQSDEARKALVASSDEIATTSPGPSNDKASVTDGAERNADAQANSTTSGEIVVKGVVLKPDGTAAAGATVRCGVPRFVERWPKLEQLATRETITVIADEHGRFEIRAKKISPDQDLNGKHRQPPSTLMPIAASLKGFGATWLDLEGVEPEKPITLELVEDYVVRGQVVDLEGRPVRGTTVTINRVDRLRREDLTGFLSTINEGNLGIAFIQPWNVRKSIGLWEIEPTLIGLPEQVTTDNEGWLEIHGLGKDRLVHLAINAGDFAYQIVTVASRSMETIQPVGIERLRSISEPIYGAPFKIAVEPTRPVEGTVVDAATGEPLAGITIGVGSRFQMEFAFPVKTTSDKAGRFRLMGLPKQSEIPLSVIPNEAQAYFRRTIEVPNPPGIEPVEMKIALHQGLWIKGRVTNKMTHEPVAGVRLHYYPLHSNDFASRLPKSDQDGDLDKDGGRYQSNPDGTYRLLGLPGPAVVGAEHHLMRFRLGVGLDEIKAPRNPETNELITWGQMNGPGVERSFTVREINPGVDERELRLDVELDPGYSVKIRATDEAGAPVKGANVFPGTRWQEKVNEKDDGVRIVENLGPDEKRVVYAHHEERELGVMINLEPPYDSGREITVVLRPLAKLAGRLLDVGEPMSGLTISCTARLNGRNMQILSAWSSDRDGRFSFPVMPGHEYKLHMHDGGNREFYAEFPQPLTFSPGEIKDLGDLELKDHEFQSAKAKPPAAKVETNKTSL